MSVFDASSYAEDLLGWRAELGARIQDFLSRRAVPVTARLGAIVRGLESAVSVGTLKSAVRDLCLYLRNQGLADGDPLEELFEQIATYRRRESIENYGEYLFTVDIRL